MQYALAQDEDDAHDDYYFQFLGFDPDFDPDPDPDPFADPANPDVAPGQLATVFNPQDFVERDIIIGEAIANTSTNANANATTGPSHTQEEGIRIIDREVPKIGFAGYEVPLFPPSSSIVAVWSLINLILCLLGVVYAVAVALRALYWKIHGKTEDRETYRPGAYEYMDNDGERRTEKRFRLLWLATTVILAAIGALLFLLKEDMRNLMVLIDWWTLPFAIIFAAEIIAVMFVFKKRRAYYEFEEAEA